MDRTRALQWFSSLTEEQQALFLAHLAHELTVDARATTYDTESAGVVEPSRLRVFNEIQHQISGHIRSLLTHSPERYPDDVLMSTVLGNDPEPGADDDPVLDRATLNAFERAKAFLERNPSDTIPYPQTPKRIGA